MKVDDTSLVQAGEKLVEQLLRRGINGFGPFKSAADSAAEALRGRTPEQAVKALVRNHCVNAGARGFVTNAGGLVTLPVALPANIGVSYLVQTHLAGAIAAVHGHDLDSEEVRSAVLLCLVGNAGTEALKRVGVTVGSKVTMTLTKRIPVTVLRQINRRVGLLLIAKYGTKRAVVTFAKGVPLVGGVMGEASIRRPRGPWAFMRTRLSGRRATTRPGLVCTRCDIRAATHSGYGNWRGSMEKPWIL